MSEPKKKRGKYYIQYRANFEGGIAGAFDELGVFDPQGRLLFTRPQTEELEREARAFVKKMNGGRENPA